LSKVKGNIKEIAAQHFEDLVHPKPRILTGFRTLDEVLNGIRHEDFAVVAGETGQFKSTVCANILLNAARMDIGSCLYSYEMSNLMNFRRIMCSETKMMLRDIENVNQTQENQDKIENKINELSEQHLYLEAEAFPTMKDLISDMTKKRNEGVRLFIIDYIQLLAMGGENSRVEQIEATSRKLKLAAKNLDAVVIGVSQFSRTHRRDNTEPELWDMKGSSALEFDPAQVIFVLSKTYANLDRNKVYIPPYVESELVLKKNRHGRAGVRTKCIILPQYYKFANIDYTDDIGKANCDEMSCMNEHCNSDTFSMTGERVVCSECNTFYTEECGCNNGLVFYEKIINGFTYEYVGLCSKCARGHAILNSTNNTNAVIENEKDKISFLPFIGHGKEILDVCFEDENGL
jgi:replicative DNA helicase